MYGFSFTSREEVEVFENRGLTLHTSTIRVEQMWLISTVIFGIVLKLHSIE